MLFDTSHPLEAALAVITRLHAGLDQLLASLTGWTSPRNALLLLGGSVGFDLVGFQLQHGTMWTWDLYQPALWVVLAVPPLLRLDRWVSSSQDTVPAFVDRYIVWSTWLLVLTVFELWHVGRLYTAGLSAAAVSELIETWLDVAIVAVAWNLTPPGRNVLARIRDYLTSSVAAPVPVRNGS